MRRSTLLALASAAVLSSTYVSAAETMAIQGTWELDTKNSQNTPESAKNVDLRITMKGRDLMTQRLVDGAPVGNAFIVTLDGVPREREIASGQRGQVTAEWKAGGKLIVQTVKVTTGVVDTVQTTSITVTEDGRVMTRVQTTRSGPDVTDRVLIYRRKK